MKKPKVAIYTRVSTQDQSCELQLSEILSFVESRGWEVYEVFEDKASGTNADRAALQRVFLDSKKRKFDILVVWKLDRFCRSLTQLVKSLEELESLNIRFVSVKDQIDLTTPSGRLLTHLIGAFAEFEAALIKERVMAGLNNAKRRGQILGRPTKINISTAIELRRSGMSLSEIAKELGVSKSAVSKTLTKHRLKKELNSSEIIEVRDE